MGLPNATSILSTLPDGLRATVSRGGVVASLAVRTAINEAGQMSLSGLDRFARVNVWTLVSDFDPRVSVGDTLTVDDVPAIVTDAMTTCAALVNRAQVVLCEDAVAIGDVSVACHLGMLGQDTLTDLGGFTPEDTQGFFVPESIIPDGVTLQPTQPVTIGSEQLIVERVSRDSRHGVLCVTARRKGAA